MSEELIEQYYDQPSALFLKKDAKAKLQGLLEDLFTAQNNSKKLVFDKFGTQQVWNQLQHFTETSNARTLSRLEKIISDTGFEEELEELGKQASELQVEEQDESYGSEKEDEAISEGQESQEGEMDQMSEERPKSMKSDEFEDFMDNFEEKY